MDFRGYLIVPAALAALLAPMLAGCHAQYRETAGGSRVGTAIIVGIVAAGEYRYYRVEPDGTRTPVGHAPPADPTRKINVQDCTRPVDPGMGNLLCR